MRAFRLFGFIVLAGLASVFVSLGSAAAQGLASDPSGGTSSATRTRLEGTYSPPRLVMPTLGELRLTLRLVLARVLTIDMLSARATGLSMPADLPARRHSL
jgi:hypothetical protein